MAGFALVTAVSATLIIWADFSAVAASFRAIGVTTVAAAAVCSLGCYATRFARWAVIARKLGYRIPAWANFHIYISGLAFTWTPAKAGELLRAIFLRRYGIRFPTAVLFFYWDRLSDLAGMTLIALAAVAATLSAHGWLIAVAAAVSLALWLIRPGGTPFTFVADCIRTRFAPRLPESVLNLRLLAEHDRHINAQLVAIAVAMAVVAYTAQSFGLVLIAHALGADVGLGWALLITSISALAGAAVLLPAGAGVVELTSVGLLMASGVASSDAVAIGLAHRLATFWFASALGAAAFTGLLRNRHG